MTEGHSALTLAESIAAFDGSPTLRSLKSRVERLAISADAKALLMDVAKVTLTVGGKILALGRKILSLAFDLVDRFQNIVFGVAVALLLSVVLASIPLLGPVITAVLTPLMLAFGIVRGALADLRTMQVRSEIVALESRLSVIAAHASK